MITAFGKILRKIRIDRGEMLKDMADTLAMSSSYLSAIEVGQRTIPKGFIEKVAEQYSLSSDVVNELYEARDLSVTKVDIQLKDSTPEQRSVAIAFARNFNELDADTLKDIQKSLEQRRKRRKK